MMSFDQTMLIRGHAVSVWVFVAFGLLFVYGVSHEFIRWKLRRAGVPLPLISTVSSSIMAFKLYFSKSPAQGWPRWPVFTSIVCPSADIAILVVWLLSRRLATH